MPCWKVHLDVDTMCGHTLARYKPTERAHVDGDMSNRDVNASLCYTPAPRRTPCPLLQRHLNARCFPSILVSSCRHVNLLLLLPSSRTLRSLECLPKPPAHKPRLPAHLVTACSPLAIILTPSFRLTETGEKTGGRGGGLQGCQLEQ